MTTTNGKRPPIDAWQVESMRVSAFPSEIVPTEQSWWNDFVGLPGREAGSAAVGWPPT